MQGCVSAWRRGTLRYKADRYAAPQPQGRGFVSVCVQGGHRYMPLRNCPLPEISPIHESAEIRHMAWYAGSHRRSRPVHPTVCSLETDLMLLIVIAFLGGAFTILSPCILPVVPFVFARSDAPFATGRLPMLLGLAGTFALVTGLGAAGLAGAAQLSEYGRWISLALFAGFGATLLKSASEIQRPYSLSCAAPDFARALRRVRCDAAVSGDRN